MARCLAVFGSLNQVALLKRALYREGVYVEMVRTPHCFASTGCSFALRFDPLELPLLQEMCRQRKIEPGGIFTEPGETDSPGERHPSEHE